MVGDLFLTFLTALFCCNSRVLGLQARTGCDRSRCSITCRDQQLAYIDPWITGLVDHLHQELALMLSQDLDVQYSVRQAALQS